MRAEEGTIRRKGMLWNIRNVKVGGQAQASPLPLFLPQSCNPMHHAGDIAMPVYHLLLDAKHDLAVTA